MELPKIPNGTALDRFTRQVSVAVVGGATLVLAVFTALAAARIVAWPDLYVITAAGEPVEIGKWVLVGATLLLLMVSALLPGSLRVLQLERSHRDFRTSMEDVTRAYWIAHAADRAGTFRLSREFDAVRERFRFLREHPDLEDIQPEILELAAQMGTESRELAQLYSDIKVNNAREMLEVRRHEAAEMQARIETAIAVTAQMKRQLSEVEMDEAMAQSALARLREELGELMPKLDAAAPAKRPRLRVATTEGKT